MRRWVTVGLVLAALIVAGWLGHDEILHGYGAWLDVGAPLDRPVTAVFVLGGGANHRPLVASGIYHAGFAERVLVSAPPMVRQDVIVPSKRRVSSMFVRRVMPVDG